MDDIDHNDKTEPLPPMSPNSALIESMKAERAVKAAEARLAAMNNPVGPEVSTFTPPVRTARSGTPNPRVPPTSPASSTPPVSPTPSLPTAPRISAGPSPTADYDRGFADAFPVAVLFAVGVIGVMYGGWKLVSYMTDCDSGTCAPSKQKSI